MNANSDLAARLERGEYEIDPKRVAEAMLRRRGRGLLVLVPRPVEHSPFDGPQGDSGPSLGAA